MKKKIIGIFVCTLMIATALPAIGIINQPIDKENKILDKKTDSDYVPGEFIVKFTQDSALSSPLIITLNNKYQVKSIEKIFKNSEGTILDNIYLLSVPENSDILSIVKDYASSSDVVYAEPHGIYHMMTNIQDCIYTKQKSSANSYIVPDDFYFDNQWALHNIGQTGGTTDCDIDAPEAWEIETGDLETVVAIIDSGIDYTHPDLTNNIWINEDEIPNNSIDDDGNGYVDDVRGWDFFYNDNDPLDGFGHGTICAGVASAVGNNGIGITGVCWDSSIMPLQVITETGGNIVYIAQAVEYAADNNADVISLSLGDFTNYSVLWDATLYAYDKGVVLAAAAGNAGSNIKLYPAAYDHVLAVAGTDHNDSIMDFFLPPPWNYWCRSSFGDWVDVAAPAQNIFTTMPTYHVFLNDYGMPNDYMWFPGGTSLSCPHVAGLAALLLSKNTLLNPDEIKTLICGNVDPYNSPFYLGTGRINAYKALIALYGKIYCEGNLAWQDVKAGSTVTGSFIIKNNGNNGSLLDWSISKKPVWGDWTITPSQGNNLETGVPLIINVTVKAPPKKNTDYTGEITIQNKNNLNDSCTLDVSMSVPKSKSIDFQFNLFGWLFKRFPNSFPILRNFFRIRIF